jgi:signal peptidase I
MEYLFRLEGRTPATSSPTLSGITVNGSTATARLKGPVHTPVEFTKAGGSWRLNCCTGSQLSTRPSTTYRIPSGSMEPTLRIGQIVTADNAAMRAHPPAVGDIIVFHPPVGADPAVAICGARKQGIGNGQACDRPTVKASVQTFIKRVVGAPGDRISIVNGRVIRNGVGEQEPQVSACTGPACNFPKPIVIPPGEYYVLGDNRGASDDSRFWGPIKRAWIIGLVRP